MCGEHQQRVTHARHKWGSSPHVRGALQPPSARQRHRGIIPACAGSTTYNVEFHTPVGDHPRMCGEHTFRSWLMVSSTGSSPHVRGARHPHRRNQIGRGIIPACAGSTEYRQTTNPPRRDHPRMCGEHYGRQQSANQLQGSSPHVRGALLHVSPRMRHGGIIPACAGSTW